MEKNLNTNQPQTTEKIPHSGNLPGDLRETPMRHFETPLADAPVNPLDINDFTATEVITAVPEKKSRKKLLIGASAGLAGVALVAGSIMGINAAMSNGTEKEPPVTDPKTPVEVEEETPTPEVQPTEGQAFEIEAGLDSEAFSQKYLELYENWINAGANESLREIGLSTDEPWETILPKIANENRDTFGDAMFPADWESNSRLAMFADRYSDINLYTLQAYTSTAWSQDTHPENVEAYRIESIYKEVSELQASESGRTVVISFANKTNGEMNIIGTAGDKDYTLSLTTAVENGVEKVTEWDFIK